MQMFTFCISSPPTQKNSYCVGTRQISDEKIKQQEVYNLKSAVARNI